VSSATGIANDLAGAGVASMLACNVRRAMVEGLEGEGIVAASGSVEVDVPPSRLSVRSESKAELVATADASELLALLALNANGEAEAATSEPERLCPTEKEGEGETEEGAVYAPPVLFCNAASTSMASEDCDESRPLLPRGPSTGEVASPTFNASRMEEPRGFAGAEKAVGTLAPPEPGSVGDAREEIESEKLDLGALVVGYESSAVTPSGGETLTAELVSAFKAPMSATDERWLLPSLSLCFDFLPLSFFFFLLSVAIGS
jgi:hypothetical protein